MEKPEKERRGDNGLAKEMQKKGFLLTTENRDVVEMRK